MNHHQRRRHSLKKARHHLDSEGPPLTSGTGKVAKPARKKTSSQVARMLQTRQRNEGDHSELDDSEQESIGNSYVVDTSDNDDSVVHESSSEEEEVVMEDDESESSSQEGLMQFSKDHVARPTTIGRRC